MKRETTTKADKAFQETADPETLQEFLDIVEGYGLTLEEMVDESWARTVFDILQIQEYLRSNPYKPTNLKRTKRLFNID